MTDTAQVRVTKAGSVWDRLRQLRGFRLLGLWVYVEPRDLWVGYFRGDVYHYVCPVPCVVVRWRRG